MTVFRRKGSNNNVRNLGHTRERCIGSTHEIFGSRDDPYKRQVAWESFNEKKMKDSIEAVAKAIALRSYHCEYHFVLQGD